MGLSWCLKRHESHGSRTRSNLLSDCVGDNDDYHYGSHYDDCPGYYDYDDPDDYDDYHGYHGSHRDHDDYDGCGDYGNYDDAVTADVSSLED